MSHFCIAHLPSWYLISQNCRFISRVDIPHKTVDSDHELELPLGGTFTKVICE